MTLQLLKLLARTAAFELMSDTAYYAPCAYSIYLNGERRATGNTNVIALFSLLPDTAYMLCLRFEDDTELCCRFTTAQERICLNITDFGAVGDGVADCTAAVQAAVACCPSGGTVYFPKGSFLCKPIFLHSGVTLYLERDAQLLGSAKRACYPILPGKSEHAASNRGFGTWEGQPLSSYASLVTAIHCHDVAVVGEGTIDGNAAAGAWWSIAAHDDHARRARTLFFNGCNGVTLLGVHVCNSPSWTIHPYYCEDVDVLAVSVQNPPDSPNTDGCNPESCHNVRIIGTHFSVGDDCIAFKSGKAEMAQAHYRCAQNLLVRNCLMDRGHGAVVLGSELACGVRNLRVEYCVMRHTDRGLRIKTRRGRGERSVVENIEFSHITMQGVETPFVINMFYHCDSDGHTPYVQSKKLLPVDSRTPTVGSLYCHDITCNGARCAGVFLYGLPENPIGNVKLERVTIAFDPMATEGMPAMLDDVSPMKQRGMLAAYVRRLELCDVKFVAHAGEPFVLDGVEEFVQDV